MGGSFYKTARWHRVRRHVLARDGQRCRIATPGICLGRATEVDHIVAMSDGGAPADLRNLQAACKPCNVSKARAATVERARVRRRQW